MGDSVSAFVRSGDRDTQSTGALIVETQGSGESSGTAHWRSVIKFNASLSNAIYSGTALQMPALQTLPCIKL